MSAIERQVQIAMKVPATQADHVIRKSEFDTETNNLAKLANNAQGTANSAQSTANEAFIAANKAVLAQGYVSTTDPTLNDAAEVYEGDIWYQPSSAQTVPDTTFPWNVRTYTNGSWSAPTPSYTPRRFNSVININDRKAYYFYLNAWHVLGG